MRRPPVRRVPVVAAGRCRLGRPPFCCRPTARGRDCAIGAPKPGVSSSAVCRYGEWLLVKSPQTELISGKFPSGAAALGDATDFNQG